MLSFGPQLVQAGGELADREASALRRGLVDHLGDLVDGSAARERRGGILSLQRASQDAQAATYDLTPAKA